MKYEKPEVVVSASALGAIRSNCGKVSNQTDISGCGSNKPSTGSAYEADE
jgi:hypothetical protein